MATQAITQILEAARRDEKEAAELLFPLLYGQLRNLAKAHPVAAGASMRPTDLVHETYLKLVSAEDRSWENRRHFIATAGMVMRQILVDRARARAAIKRGGNAQREDVLEALATDESRDEQILDVDASLDALAAVDERAAKVTTLRFFLGLTESEIADALGVSDRTVRRDWIFARSWLARHLRSQQSR